MALEFKKDIAALQAMRGLKGRRKMLAHTCPFSASHCQQVKDMPGGRGDRQADVPGVTGLARKAGGSTLIFLLLIRTRRLTKRDL